MCACAGPTLRPSSSAFEYTTTTPAGTGTLNAPCADQMAASEAETLARNALAKRSVYKQCLSAEAEPVSYSYSQVGKHEANSNRKRGACLEQHLEDRGA